MLKSAAVSRAAVSALLVLSGMSVVLSANDLSTYRNVRLGADLPTVARQVGVNTSQVKLVHLRPALIQELEWRPQMLASSSKTESVQEVVFSFYNGELFRVAVDYDRYAIEGMTADDLITAISAAYGVAERPGAPANILPMKYGAPEEIVARWQDSQYCFELIRSPDGPRFRLAGVLRRLEGPAQAAIAEAKRLDDKEAPQREAARIIDENAAERARLEKVRLVNKPNFHQ
jgi:hypothetical protein